MGVQLTGVCFFFAEEICAAQMPSRHAVLSFIREACIALYFALWQCALSLVVVTSVGFGTFMGSRGSLLVCTYRNGCFANGLEPVVSGAPFW
jgi:hypothetical protein